MGLMNNCLKRKFMLVVYLQSLGVVELIVLGCKGVLVSEAGLHSYLFIVCITKNSSSNLVLCLYHVYWFNEYVQLCY